MFLRRTLSTWSLPTVLVLALLATACGKDGTSSNAPSGYACSGTPAQCLRLSYGWAFEGMTITDPNVSDVAAVRLPDGRYRIYGGAMIDPIANKRVYHSYISIDGVHFTEEAGYRLTGIGIHAGDVVAMPTGGFRMYFTDQANGALNSPIRSAFSADGMTFTVEPGARVAPSGTGYEVDGVGNGRPVVLPNGSMRMYYHGHANGKDYLLSATSTDGLAWTREAGVRLQSATLCPPEEGVRNVNPILDAHGALHLFVTATLCTGNYVNARAGIWDASSTDGLTFSFAERPLVEGYYYKATYTGSPSDPGVSVGDPAPVRTPDGLRVFLQLGSVAGIVPETGIYSISLRT